MRSEQTVPAVHIPDSLSRTEPSSLVTAASLAGVGAVAGLAVLWATAGWGIGVSADSTVYIGAARSLLSQGSLLDVDSFGRAVPMVHYPPFFPLVLAAMSGLFQIDPVVAARWLIACLFGINTALLGAAVWRILDSSRLGLVSAILALVFTPMIALHQMALSEPLYICLALCAFLLMLRYLGEPSMTRLIVAAIATGLAFSTRYAGIAVVLTGGLALLLLQRKKLSLAVRDALVFSTVSCLPVAAWLLRNHFQSGTASDFFNGKALKLDSSIDTILAGVNTASTWMLPGNVPLALRIVTAAGLALALFLAVRRAGIPGHRLDSERAILPAAAGLFVVCNLLVLLATVLVLDGTTPMDDRLLLPLFAPLALLLLWAVQNIYQRETGVAIRILPAVVVGLLLLTNSLRSVKHLQTTARSGRGYSAQEWQQSNLLAQLRSSAGAVPVYATLPSAIRFLTTQTVRQLPNTFNPRTERRNENYEREMSSLYRESQDPGIAIVYFKSSVNRWYPAEAELVRTLNLTLLTSDSQGSLYVSPRLAAPQRTAHAATSRTTPQ